MLKCPIGCYKIHGNKGKPPTPRQLEVLERGRIKMAVNLLRKKGMLPTSVLPSQRQRQQYRQPTSQPRQQKQQKQSVLPSNLPTISSLQIKEPIPVRQAKQLAPDISSLQIKEPVPAIQQSSRKLQQIRQPTQLEKEQAALEFYESMYRDNPSPSLKRIIERQKKRVLDATT